MPGNSFGTIFRITNWGKSHGKAIGAVIDGCPPLLKLSEEDIQKELDKRRPGQSEITTQRKEADKVEILSGVFRGLTTGTPISLIIYNNDFRNQDYDEIKNVFRPSHADFTYETKYGVRDPFGGGRSSARITAGNVAAGAIAKKILRKNLGVEIIAYVKQVKNITAEIDPMKVTEKDVYANITRCPDHEKSSEMIGLIKEPGEKGDSVGGVIECVIRNVPAGLGEPIFDKLEADLSKAIMSINAVKGFEVGSGFKGTEMFGSEHNDPFIVRKEDDKEKITTEPNHS